MKIEGGASGQAKGSGPVGHGGKVIQRKGSGGGGGGGYNRRPRGRVEDMSTTIQRLFVACKSVFKGPGTVPSPADVRMLRQLLDEMKLEDVGLSNSLPFFQAGGAVRGVPRITYTRVHSCENFSICIFFLPPTAVIPLHNHPGMTVFSKVLRGSMHIKAYDFVAPAVSDDTTPSARRRLARLKVDSDFTAPCDTSILYPAAGGNIHRFTAITPCAVLDVLGPPYSTEDGRDCTYYTDEPCSSTPVVGAAAEIAESGDGRCAWLEEIDEPEELKMDGIPYMGPQILDL